MMSESCGDYRMLDCADASMLNVRLVSLNSQFSHFGFSQEDRVRTLHRRGETGS